MSESGRTRPASPEQRNSRLSRGTMGKDKRLLFQGALSLGAFAA